MFLEDPLKKDGEQQRDHSYTHKYKDTESDYLYCGIDDPCITHTDRYDSKKNSCREVGYGEQQRVLDGLLDCLIKPSDERECIRCR